MLKRVLTYLLLSHMVLLAQAQPVTGVWKGRVSKGGKSYKLELKLIKTGDSLVGTSYYYASANNYYRYTVKGFFDGRDNSVNWWDDQLVENKTGSALLGGSANSLPMMSAADFNCPGSGIMKLDGNTHPKDGGYSYEIHMDKYPDPSFHDEWDPIIENYFYGGAEPGLIDSVSKIALRRKAVPQDVAIVAPSQKPFVIPPPIAQPKEDTKPKLIVIAPPVPQTKAEPKLIVIAPPVPQTKAEPKLIVIAPPVPQPRVETKPIVIAPPVAQPKVEPATKPITEPKDVAVIAPPVPKPVVVPPQPEVRPIPKMEPVIVKAEPPVVKLPPLPTPPTVEEKFVGRKTVFNSVIPVTADSIEFRFYDNAEVDGDSISIFLNKRLLATHVRLTTQPFRLWISRADLGDENELVMVAENLGSIPPNTAFMEAFNGTIRYTARMESTEVSSAMIRLLRR